jgi:hypothetical protein
VAENDSENASQPKADVISFEWLSELGEPGEDDDAGNPFYRSLNHLFETGSPFKTLAFSFVATENGCRWFGVFVEGKHIVFFPPFSEAYDSAEVGKDGAASTRSFDLDHLTLDLSQRNWHVTSANRTDRIRARPLHDVGDGRALWFGMSFNDPGRLRQLAKITSCRFTAPPSDSARRREIVRRAREGINFPLMYVPDNPGIGAASFMHASVIVGKPGFATYLGADHAFPHDNLLTSAYPPDPVSLLSRIYRLSLSSVDLQLTLFRVPGQLRRPVVFGAP